MFVHSVSLLLLGATSTFHIAGVSAAPRLHARDGSKPSLPYDPNTTEYCTWWVDLTSPQSCLSLVAENAITLEDFRRWNPSIPEPCNSLEAGRSYCVEAFFEPKPSSTSTTVAPSTTSPTSAATTSSAPSTTTPSNGIQTPSPVQPGITPNCAVFHFVESGEYCALITSRYSITLAQFIEWNPSVGDDCSGLWADTYVCVGVIGGTPVTTATPTTTTPSNGIQTPSPIQPGMTPNCNAFHLVKSGEYCALITSRYSITLAQFVQWNPSVGDDCSGLWADVYVCVGVIGETPVTTTTPANGIQTPTPTHPGGLPSSCSTFYKVNPGDTCDAIASKSRISTSDFVNWNPGVGGSQCRTLQAGYYVCVGLIGATPTPTQGNGVATPTPTHPGGLPSNCRSFYKVNSGDTCDAIASKNRISTADFIKWNAGVGGSQCRTLQAGYYVCVALLP